MKLIFYIWIILIILSSCNDEKYDVNTLILINNKTQHNLHFIFKTKDKSMPDSIYLQFRNRNDSVSSGDFEAHHLQLSTNFDRCTKLDASRSLINSYLHLLSLSNLVNYEIDI